MEGKEKTVQFWLPAFLAVVFLALCWVITPLIYWDVRGDDGNKLESYHYRQAENRFWQNVANPGLDDKSPVSVLAQATRLYAATWKKANATALPNTSVEVTIPWNDAFSKLEAPFTVDYVDTADNRFWGPLYGSAQRFSQRGLSAVVVEAKPPKLRSAVAAAAKPQRLLYKLAGLAGCAQGVLLIVWLLSWANRSVIQPRRQPYWRDIRRLLADADHLRDSLQHIDRNRFSDDYATVEEAAKEVSELVSRLREYPKMDAQARANLASEMEAHRAAQDARVIIDNHVIPLASKLEAKVEVSGGSK